jgi:hypothetical protein
MSYSRNSGIYLKYLNMFNNYVIFSNYHPTPPPHPPNDT